MGAQLEATGSHAVLGHRPIIWRRPAVQSRAAPREAETPRHRIGTRSGRAFRWPIPSRVCGDQDVVGQDQSEPRAVRGTARAADRHAEHRRAHHRGSLRARRAL